MRELNTVIDQYVAIWNETDPGRRRRLITDTWVEVGTYADPMMRGDGHAGFDAMVQGVQDQFPGHMLERTTAIDAHGDHFRFGWALVDEATSLPLVAGVDFGQRGPDGRLLAITGFIDRAPGMEKGS